MCRGIASKRKRILELIHVTEHIVLADDELEEQFIRCSGPGGQHVNTASTGVQLRFDAMNSPTLSDSVRRRLLNCKDNRMTAEGVIVINATSFRSQKANREDAQARLIAMIRVAATPPKFRRKTRPSRAAKTRRLEGKKRRSVLKRTRGAVRED